MYIFFLFFFLFYFLFEYKFIRNYPIKLIKVESIFKILTFWNYFSIYLSIFFYTECGQLWHIRLTSTTKNKMFPVKFELCRWLTNYASKYLIYAVNHCGCTCKVRRSFFL